MGAWPWRRLSRSPSRRAAAPLTFFVADELISVFLIGEEGVDENQRGVMGQCCCSGAGAIGNMPKGGEEGSGAALKY